jgi:hypothetical protein
MPKSLSKTPAPKKDRIYGSDKNKVGSASSKASAKGIELSESILGTLSQKAKDYNESHPKNKVSVATIKAVMRRGMGAYSTSHRPTITSGAPNSRQAWGFARVNKFLKKKAGQQVKAAYVQDDDLMEKGGLIAPNGKKSNLTPEQYKLVRTPEFKAWFGDWENDPKNASKVVDENGEPLVVYHGTDAKFNVFDINRSKYGFFFTNSYDLALTYDKNVYQFFLNIRKPRKKDFKGANYDGDYQLKDYSIRNIGYDTKTFASISHPNLGYNGAIMKNVMDIGEGGWNENLKPSNIYVVFEPNQIKLADGTNKTFDMNNPDIRYADGGSIGQEITCVNCGWHWNTKDSDESDKYVCHKCGFDNRTFYDPEPIGEYHLGGDMSKHLAPNGKPSNLNHEQWHLVRTPEFKAWFGDWENDPENASKVVDENGEPLVVFRGFNKVHDKGFVFKFNINRFKNNRKTNKFGHYFTISEKVAKEYAEQGEKQDEKDIIIKSYFLNIRNLLDITKANKRYPTFEEWSVVREKGFRYSKYDILEKLKRREIPIHSYLFDETPLDVKDENDLDEVSEAKIKQLEKIIAKQDAEMKEFYNSSETVSLPALIHIITGESREVIDEKLNELQENESLKDEAYVNRYIYDWFIKYKSKDFRFMEDLDDYLKKLIIDNGYDGVKFIENMIGSVRGLTDSVYVTFDSNQIKLADGSNTTFDSKNPDIRYEYGGSLAIPSQHDLIKMELGLELFKPSKTIEQIAKEKDVPLDYAEEQLRKGMKTESEHSDNPIVQETIALQHLDEMIDYYDKLEYMESQNKMAKGDLLDNSLFNKALIYKSIKPIRQANEIIERLDYMEIQNKMAKGGVTEFYKQYQDWYKNGVSDKMTIMVSIPNAFSKMSSDDNHVILEVFEKTDESVDGKKKLTELLEIADKNEIDVYLEPIPRHNKIKDEAKKEKITREYLISYYKKFGFELLPNGFMVRKYKNNKMEKGGYYKAGGEINPDDKNVKDYFSHGSGNVGGVLVGKRHSEGGIKAVNKSTNQPLEMEGGEVVITRNAVSDNEKREFEGKMMTNREILSKINESGGGVSFADGGDIPESIYTSGKEYKYGGKMMKDHEIVSSCGCKHSMAEGGIAGDLHSLTNQLLAQKIEIFIKKVQPIKFYYIDEDSNSLIIGLDENYTTGMAEKLHKEATSSAEFFDADSINMEYNQNTGHAQYSIKLKKVAKFGKGGKMAEGGRLNIGTIKKTDSDVIFDKQSGAFYLNVIDGAGNRTNKLNVNTIDDIFEKYPSFKLNKLGEKEFEDYMAEGGETDYQTELKNHLFPKIEVDVEVEVEPIMEEMPINEHYITADDLGLSDGMPMLAVGTIVYSSGGNDQWEVVSFSDDGVNLVNKPKSPLQSKMEDKHLTFDELIKYFKDKAISIKNISTERELEPAIALVRHKIPQKSYAMGGFIDGDEDEDARIMQSQFGKSNFK